MGPLRATAGIRQPCFGKGTIWGAAPSAPVCMSAPAGRVGRRVARAVVHEACGAVWIVPRTGAAAAIAGIHFTAIAGRVGARLRRPTLRLALGPGEGAAPGDRREGEHEVHFAPPPPRRPPRTLSRYSRARAGPPRGRRGARPPHIPAPVCPTIRWPSRRVGGPLRIATRATAARVPGQPSRTQ